MSRTINDQARLALARELKWRAITQRALAERLEISEKHLSHVLNGHSTASLGMLDNLAKALGCTWHIGISPDDEINHPAGIGS